jgi:hypothetical protein
MFGLLTLGIAAAAGVLGHTKARKFVGRKLRFTPLVEKPYLGVAVGVTAAVIASPVVALLPLVGAGTAIAFGTGVGTGAALGARDAKRPLLED